MAAYSRMLFVATGFLASRSSAFLVRSNLPQRAFVGRFSAPSNTQRQFSFFMNMFSGSSFASKDEVANALSNKKAVLVDIRGQDEINADGKVTVGDHPWVHAPGSPTSNDVLSSDAKKLLPDLDVPVIVYCASGKRAAKAKEILEEKGYKTVLNAGGAANFRELLK